VTTDARARDINLKNKRVRDILYEFMPKNFTLRVCLRSF